MTFQAKLALDLNMKVVWNVISSNVALEIISYDENSRR